MGFADDFVRTLQKMEFRDAFNPYRDECDKHDQRGAPKGRSENLRSIVKAAQEQGVEDMWIGLAPGHHGARRTGLALTDDFTLPYHGKRWGVPVIRPTHGKLISERTASATWLALCGIEGKNIFLWNVFPLHPHEQANPLSNREEGKITQEELEAGKELLAKLVKTLCPKRLIAIGRVAESAGLQLAKELKTHGLDCGQEVHYVPHPGRKKNEFLVGIHELYPQAVIPKECE